MSKPTIIYRSPRPPRARATGTPRMSPEKQRRLPHEKRITSKGRGRITRQLDFDSLSVAGSINTLPGDKEPVQPKIKQKRPPKKSKKASSPTKRSQEPGAGENIAVKLFHRNVNSGNPNKPSRNQLNFDVQYHSDTCGYLLRLVTNHSQYIPILFGDPTGEDDNNTESFKRQVKALAELQKQKALAELQKQKGKPALFISMEPGKRDHYVLGVIYNGNLLLINPYGIKNDDLMTEEDHTAYQTLQELQTEGIIKKLFLSDTPILNHTMESVHTGTGLVSCGPIICEIAINILQNLDQQGLKGFIDGINTKIPDLKDECQYYPVSISPLLVVPEESLNDLATLDQQKYQARLVQIRKRHCRKLSDLPKQQAETTEPDLETINSFLEKCLNESPEQIEFNLKLYEGDEVVETSTTASESDALGTGTSTKPSPDEQNNKPENTFKDFIRSSDDYDPVIKAAIARNTEAADASQALKDVWSHMQRDKKTTDSSKRPIIIEPTGPFKSSSNRKIYSQFRIELNNQESSIVFDFNKTEIKQVALNIIQNQHRNSIDANGNKIEAPEALSVFTDSIKQFAENKQNKNHGTSKAKRYSDLIEAQKDDSLNSYESDNAVTVDSPDAIDSTDAISDRWIDYITIPLSILSDKKEKEEEEEKRKKEGYQSQTLIKIAGILDNFKVEDSITPSNITNVKNSLEEALTQINKSSWFGYKEYKDALKASIRRLEYYNDFKELEKKFGTVPAILELMSRDKYRYKRVIIGNTTARFQSLIKTLEKSIDDVKKSYPLDGDLIALSGDVVKYQFNTIMNPKKTKKVDTLKKLIGDILNGKSTRLELLKSKPDKMVPLNVSRTFNGYLKQYQEKRRAFYQKALLDAVNSDDPSLLSPFAEFPINSRADFDTVFGTNKDDLKKNDGELSEDLDTKLLRRLRNLLPPENPINEPSVVYAAKLREILETPENNADISGLNKFLKQFKVAKDNAIFQSLLEKGIMDENDNQNPFATVITDLDKKLRKQQHGEYNLKNYTQNYQPPVAEVAATLHKALLAYASNPNPEGEEAALAFNHVSFENLLAIQTLQDRPNTDLISFLSEKLSQLNETDLKVELEKQFIAALTTWFLAKTKDYREQNDNSDQDDNKTALDVFKEIVEFDDWDNWSDYTKKKIAIIAVKQFMKQAEGDVLNDVIAMIGKDADENVFGENEDILKYSEIQDDPEIKELFLDAFKRWVEQACTNENEDTLNKIIVILKYSEIQDDPEVKNLSLNAFEGWIARACVNKNVKTLNDINNKIKRLAAWPTLSSEAKKIIALIAVKQFMKQAEGDVLNDVIAMIGKDADENVFGENEDILKYSEIQDDPEIKELFLDAFKRWVEQACTNENEDTLNKIIGMLGNDDEQTDATQDKYAEIISNPDAQQLFAQAMLALLRIERKRMPNTEAPYNKYVHEKLGSIENLLSANVSLELLKKAKSEYNKANVFIERTFSDIAALREPVAFIRDPSKPEDANTRLSTLVEKAVAAYDNLVSSDRQSDNQSPETTALQDELEANWEAITEIMRERIVPGPLHPDLAQLAPLAKLYCPDYLSGTHTYLQAKQSLDNFIESCQSTNTGDESIFNEELITADILKFFTPDFIVLSYGDAELIQKLETQIAFITTGAPLFATLIEELIACIKTRNTEFNFESTINTYLDGNYEGDFVSALNSFLNPNQQVTDKNFELRTALLFSKRDDKKERLKALITRMNKLAKTPDANNQRQIRQLARLLVDTDCRNESGRKTIREEDRDLPYALVDHLIMNGDYKPAKLIAGHYKLKRGHREKDVRRSTSLTHLNLQQSYKGYTTEEESLYSDSEDSIELLQHSSKPQRKPYTAIIDQIIFSNKQVEAIISLLNKKVISRDEIEQLKPTVENYYLIHSTQCPPDREPASALINEELLKAISPQFRSTSLSNQNLQCVSLIKTYLGFAEQELIDILNLDSKWVKSPKKDCTKEEIAVKKERLDFLCKSLLVFGDDRIQQLTISIIESFGDFVIENGCTWLPRNVDYKHLPGEPRLKYGLLLTLLKYVDFILPETAKALQVNKCLAKANEDSAAATAFTDACHRSFATRSPITQLKNKLLRELNAYILKFVDDLNSDVSEDIYNQVKQRVCSLQSLQNIANKFKKTTVQYKRLTQLDTLVGYLGNLSIGDQGDEIKCYDLTEKIKAIFSQTTKTSLQTTKTSSHWDDDVDNMPFGSSSSTPKTTEPLKHPLYDLWFSKQPDFLADFQQGLERIQKAQRNINDSSFGATQLSQPGLANRTNDDELKMLNIRIHEAIALGVLQELFKKIQSGNSATQQEITANIDFLASEVNSLKTVFTDDPLDFNDKFRTQFIAFVDFIHTGARNIQSQAYPMSLPASTPIQIATSSETNHRGEDSIIDSFHTGSRNIQSQAINMQSASPSIPIATDSMTKYPSAPSILDTIGLIGLDARPHLTNPRDESDNLKSEHDLEHELQEQNNQFTNAIEDLNRINCRYQQVQKLIDAIQSFIQDPFNSTSTLNINMHDINSLKQAFTNQTTDDKYLRDLKEQLSSVVSILRDVISQPIIIIEKYQEEKKFFPQIKMNASSQYIPVYRLLYDREKQTCFLECHTPKQTQPTIVEIKDLYAKFFEGTNNIGKKTKEQNAIKNYFVTWAFRNHLQSRPNDETNDQKVLTLFNVCDLKADEYLTFRKEQNKRLNYERVVTAHKELQAYPDENNKTFSVLDKVANSSLSIDDIQILGNPYLLELFECIKKHGKSVNINKEGDTIRSHVLEFINTYYTNIQNKIDTYLIGNKEISEEKINLLIKKLELAKKFHEIFKTEEGNSLNEYEDKNTLLNWHKANVAYHKLKLLLNKLENNTITNEEIKELEEGRSSLECINQYGREQTDDAADKRLREKTAVKNAINLCIKKLEAEVANYLTNDYPKSLGKDKLILLKNRLMHCQKLNDLFNPKVTAINLFGSDDDNQIKAIIGNIREGKLASRKQFKNAYQLVNSLGTSTQKREMLDACVVYLDPVSAATNQHNTKTTLQLINVITEIDFAEFDDELLKNVRIDTMKEYIKEAFFTPDGESKALKEENPENFKSLKKMMYDVKGAVYWRDNKMHKAAKHWLKIQYARFTCCVEELPEELPEETPLLGMVNKVKLDSTNYITDLFNHEISELQALQAIFKKLTVPVNNEDDINSVLKELKNPLTIVCKDNDLARELRAVALAKYKDSALAHRIVGQINRRCPPLTQTEKVPKSPKQTTQLAHKPLGISLN